MSKTAVAALCVCIHSFKPTTAVLEKSTETKVLFATVFRFKRLFKTN